ncbi:hypothetical protein PIROE2DRAFT_59219 [Piromyces sp. E2]|nr:hypothetical protein PIROE2DRAFT_59219 [Piromyces sp. E2]|eukprot:OUM66713.1 hypothetical protein PIROE2DRAFT_59219 [Piromyces sp. E2]
MMILKNIVLTFGLLIASAMSESFHAYDFNTDNRLTTYTGKKLHTYFIDNASCWFADGLKKACCIDRGDITYVGDHGNQTGDKWKHCVTVKKGNKITYIEYHEYLSKDDRIERYCTKKEVTLNGNLKDARAHCVKTGCLTRYGWVNRAAIASQRNC